MSSPQVTRELRRLGPLYIEAKKRTVAKRAKFEKNIEDQKKPQNITEQDIERSGNETTKTVTNVSDTVRVAFASWLTRLSAGENFDSYGKDQSVPVHHQSS